MNKYSIDKNNNNYNYNCIKCKKKINNKKLCIIHSEQCNFNIDDMLKQINSKT
jgi:hypothetical protein